MEWDYVTIFSVIWILWGIIILQPEVGENIIWTTAYEIKPPIQLHRRCTI